MTGTTEPVLVDLDDLIGVFTLATSTTLRYDREQGVLERIARLIAAADPDGPDEDYLLRKVHGRPALVIERGVDDAR